MRGVYVLLLISLLGYAGRVGGQESVTITQCYEWARANYPQIHQMGLIDQTIWDGGSARSARALTRAEAIANREQLESELYTLKNDRRKIEVSRRQIDV